MHAKCIKFYEFGSPQDVLKVENRDIQKPINNEILVRMNTRPINPSDLIPIRGAYSHRIPLPAIPGYEGVGTVEDVGPLVNKSLIGKRVLPLRGEGTWQDYVKTSADLAIHVPQYIDDYTAAQLYINPITAWVVCTEILNLKINDILLVNACGSSIGRILAQLSNVLGFRLVAITRNNKHSEELLQLGASNVINTSEISLHNAVMELTNGKGAHAAIDSIGGIDGTQLAHCVKPRGIFLTIGLLSGLPINWTEIAQSTDVVVKMFHLRHWNSQVSVKTWQETFEVLMTLVKEKRLTLTKPQTEFGLSEIQKAVYTAESSNKGKIFLST